MGGEFRDILNPTSRWGVRGEKYSARVGVNALRCQSEGSQTLVYSCPNPSVSLQMIVRTFVKGKKNGNALDSQPQLILQSLDIIIRWQVQSIEACMASW